MASAGMRLGYGFEKTSFREVCWMQPVTDTAIVNLVHFIASLDAAP